MYKDSCLNSFLRYLGNTLNLMADNQEEEPSIEEILTSIRQIISDDDDEGGDDASGEEPVAEEPADEPEEVIELTEKADPDDVLDDDFEPEPVMEEPEDEPMEIDLKDSDDFEPEPEAEPTPEPEPVREQPPEDDGDSILTNRAEEAALSGFKQLAAKTAIDSISGVTIEQIVREELRPMLRVWLDSNLPHIVERLVQEELDKVARRALDD